MSASKSVVAVFGYNNTRLYDVKKIKEIVEKQFDHSLLLVKEGINDSDLAVTPFCFDHPPDDPKVVTGLKDYLKTESLHLVGCLPFSDKGVIGAAFAAREFGLKGDHAESSFAMLNKHLFRELEKEIDLDDKTYKKPFFQVCYTEESLKIFFETAKTFFIKPCSEGNSRGCMLIDSEKSLEDWIKTYSKSLAQGVICEEVLGSDSEFSFDGVGGRYWITKKYTTSGAYRAEYQHIVPAPFEEHQRQKIHSVLEPLMEKLGSRGGAFHHEFFLLKDGRIASVEPNRRPAGMWLWDLAKNSFDEFDPWTAWISGCIGKNESIPILKQKQFSGVRGIISRESGILKCINHEAIKKEFEKKWPGRDYRLEFFKSSGAALEAVPRDNSDFIAFVALSHKDSDVLIHDLEQAEEIILGHLEVDDVIRK